MYYLCACVHICVRTCITRDVGTRFPFRVKKQAPVTQSVNYKVRTCSFEVVVWVRLQEINISPRNEMMETVYVCVCTGGPWNSSRLIVALKLHYYSEKVISPLCVCVFVTMAAVRLSLSRCVCVCNE